MATKRALAERWKTEDGRSRAARLMGILEQHAEKFLGFPVPGVKPTRRGCDDLRDVTAGFVFADEVAGRLDLRGLEFGMGLSLVHLDLARARLDGAKFEGNVVDCNLAGAVLDGARSTNSRFDDSDLANASMVGAQFRGAMFFRANLIGANCTSAKLQSAQLWETPCAGATLAGADLRGAWCPKLDLRGADLTDANLGDASLGEAQFDERTKLERTRLVGAAMNDDFRAFAIRAGAILGASEGDDTVAAFRSTIEALRRHNTDRRLDALIAKMSSLGTVIPTDPRRDWFEEIAKEFPELVPDIELAIADSER